MVKARKPSVSFESGVDNDFLMDYLSMPFDLYDSLSRFLIVENEDNYSLFASFHHIIFDAISNNVFKQDLQTILDGGVVDLDDSFLKVSAFTQEIQKTSEYIDAKNFYDYLLADLDEAGSLLDDVCGDGPGISEIGLDLDYDLFKAFLDEHGLSENAVFTSVFAYTLSRYVGSDKVFFNITENGRDRFNNFNAIGMHVNTLPILADCKNQDVHSFMTGMSDLVYDVTLWNTHPRYWKKSV